jgi:hypothetical protein
MLYVMSIWAFFLLFILLLIGWASYAISAVVVKKLVKTENTNMKLLRGLIMVGTFVIISAAIFFLIMNNITIGR